MLIELSVTSFRNLEKVSAWRPGRGAQLLLGSNGAGKTSLLEAIYLLATTRSFRTPHLAECARHGGESFNLRGRTEEEAMRTSLEFHWQEGARQRRANGKSGTLAEHLAVLPVISWTQEDHEVLVGPPERRRKFMDRGVVVGRPSGLEVLAHYRQALEQKRRLLERGGGASLAAWNELLAPLAVQIAAWRLDYVKRLGSILHRLLGENDLLLPDVDLKYRPSLASSSGGALAVLEELRAKEREELDARRPLCGPQRDEMEVIWDGRRVKRVASAGERKALGVALTAARGMLLEEEGREPIYLLDDLDSELDHDRLGQLLRLFEQRQVFISSSKREIWKGVIEAQEWSVKEGNLQLR